MMYSMRFMIYIVVFGPIVLVLNCAYVYLCIKEREFRLSSILGVTDPWRECLKTEYSFLTAIGDANKDEGNKNG